MIEELREGLFTDRPTHITGGIDEYSEADLHWIAQQFAVDPDLTVSPFQGKGNINLHTYLVRAGGAEYLLQKVNSNVFTLPHRVMSSMIASLNCQRQALADGADHGDWEPIELVPVRDGAPYLDLTDEKGWSVWRLMVRISRGVSYKNLSELASRQAQLELARETGRGLAIFSDLSTGIDINSVEGSLPGYRDTKVYFDQLDAVLAEVRTIADAMDRLPHDPIVRASTEQHFLVALDSDAYQSRKNDPELAPYLSLVERNRPAAMMLWGGIEAGTLRKSIIHGDTKLENFLFSTVNGRARSLVDLDTIMAFTWLADYGDMQRSMVNVAGEKERDLSKVDVDVDVYRAVRDGFLDASTGATDSELALMDDAVKAITLELGVRFLTDYLRGDTYFRLGPEDAPDLNKVRALVQLRLFEKLEEIF